MHACNHTKRGRGESGQSPVYLEGLSSPEISHCLRTMPYFLWKLIPLQLEQEWGEIGQTDRAFGSVTQGPFSLVPLVVQQFDINLQSFLTPTAKGLSLPV